MSRNSAYRERFFQENPLCCFCGGTTSATQEDHFPSRALFVDRAWPEGYAFPACANCNHVTENDELIVALISRMRGGGAQQVAAEQELRKYMEGIRRFYPGLLENMRPRTHREFREARKKYGLALESGQVSTDLPIMRLTDPRIQNAVLQFGRKLGLALYYKHTNRPLSATGGVALRWYSNTQIDADQIPRELADTMPVFPKLARGKTILTDQFFYRIGITEGAGMGVFLAMFRQSFAIVGFMSSDAEVFPADAGPMKSFPVYRWPQRP